MKLSKKLYKNIAKASSKECYHKNVNFMKRLFELKEENKLSEILLIERNFSSNFYTELESNLFDRYWYNLVEIDGNCMPVPVLIDILWGENYIKFKKKYLKRLAKVYYALVEEFTTVICVSNQ